MKNILLVVMCTFALIKIQAQGPPITADKPIMLGGNSVIIKTLTEIRNTDDGSFGRIPVMIHYLQSSNSLIAIHIPWTTYNFKVEGTEKMEEE